MNWPRSMKTRTRQRSARSCYGRPADTGAEPAILDQFRRDWLNKPAPREAEDLAGDAPPAPQGAWMLRAFSGAFSWLAMGLLIFGTVF